MNAYATVFALLLLIGPARSALAQQDQIQGPVRIVDGDTLDVGSTRVRLWGIDAPESHQQCERDGAQYACGTEATAYLSAIIAARAVVCEPRTLDRYKRTVALCRVAGEDSGAAMVAAGWAVAFTRYSRDYALQEREAHEARRGIWAGAFVVPSLWRAGQR